MKDHPVRSLSGLPKSSCLSVQALRAPCREVGEHQNSPGGRCRVRIYCELSSKDAAQIGKDLLCTINKNVFKALFTELFSSWLGTAEGIQIIILSNY